MSPRISGNKCTSCPTSSTMTSAKSICFLFIVSSLLSLAMSLPQHDHNAHSPHDKTLNDQDNMTPEVPATNDPTFVSKAETLEAREGDSLDLPCEVKDLGPYVVLWKKGIASILFAGHLQVLKESRLSLQKHNLRIDDLKKSDAGLYTCQVSTSPPRDIQHTIIVHEKGAIVPHLDRNVQDNEVSHAGSTGSNENSASTTVMPTAVTFALLFSVLTLLAQQSRR